MTGAMFDGAGDSPPPRHRGRSRRSLEEDQEQNLPLLQLRGSGRSPPPLDRGRSRQQRKEGNDENPPKLQLGEELSCSGRRCDPFRQSHGKVRDQNPPALRIRGGAGSDGNRSKKRTLSPAPSLKSYRLDTGDSSSGTKTQRASPGSYTPGDTWDIHHAMKSKKGSTGSYTPDDKWGSGGATTWEPGNKSGNNIPWPPSKGELKENKQRDTSNASSQKRNKKLADSWGWIGGAKNDENQDDQKWDADDSQNGDNWDSTGNMDRGRQDSGWGAVNNNKMDDQNEDQSGNWDNTDRDDKSQHSHNWRDTSNKNDPKSKLDMGNDQKNIQNDDQNNNWSAGSSKTNVRSGSWDNGGAKTPTPKIHNKNASSKAPSKAVSSADESKSGNIQGRVSIPPSILTPATKLNASKGVSSKAPSAVSLESALKSPFGGWALTKGSPLKVSDEVVDRAGAIPGAWSPPLEKKETTRSESTKRRAAELNVERAKVRAAELDAESLKAGSQCSKPVTPLYTTVFKPISRPTTPAPSTFKSRIFQTHRKRPSTVVEEEPGVAEVTNDDGPTHEVRPVSPAGYTHKICAPHYMDTMADPYAHFVFHYRDMAVISKMCNTTIVETREEMQSRFTNLTKQELLELLIGEKLAAGEEADENLTWKTSPGKAGYKPNLNAANEKLDEWGNNQANSGRNDWENNNSGGNEWGNSDHSRGDVDNPNDNQDNDNQGGDSWGNDDNGDSDQNQGGAHWGNSNDNSRGNAGWCDSNQPCNSHDNASGGGNGEADGGW